jgi:hypothetical protein
VDETLDEVLHNGAVVFVQDDDKVNYKARVRCDLREIWEGMPLAKVQLMLQKDSLLVDILNRAISRNELHLKRLSQKYLEKSMMERVCKDEKGFKALSKVKFGDFWDELFLLILWESVKLRTFCMWYVGGVVS